VKNMENKILHSLEDVLHGRRRDLLKEFWKDEEDLEFIAADRESELEERAQEERCARLLARLDDRTLHAVQEIDAALQRLSEGRYGVCDGCGKNIAIGRLRALPATPYCRDCAGREGKRPGTAGKETAAASLTARVPGDLNLLDDSELAEAIREHLKEDGRIDGDELRIICREGVVHLSGVLPSETEHQILLQVVTDVLGLKEVVDDIRVEELLWEREDRSKKELAEKPLPWQEPYGTEDIVECEEEGKEFVAPSAPTPEEE
jgi:RNA polymerase-binding transcription factor